MCVDGPPQMQNLKEEASILLQNVAAHFHYVCPVASILFIAQLQLIIFLTCEFLSYGIGTLAVWQHNSWPQIPHALLSLLYMCFLGQVLV